MTTKLHIYLTATTIHVLTTNCCISQALGLQIYIGQEVKGTYILIQSGFQPFDFYWDNDDDDDV